jgi:hypothetical protein
MERYPLVSLLLGGGLVLGFAATAQGQQTIVAPSRSIDWSRAGVTGGIPTRTTNCATLSPGVTAAQISLAIETCPSGQVVRLNAGTYNLNAGIDFDGKSNVTLRGAGADQTRLVFTGDTGCQGQRAHICIDGVDLGYYGPGPPTRVVNWTAGYSQGATSLTLSATTGLSVGMRIVLDQLDDASDTGHIFVCTEQTCTQQGGGGNGRDNRAQRQIVTVTGIAGTTVTFTPGLYMPNWRSARTPQAWWGTPTSLSGWDGIEDLSIDATNGHSFISAITMMMTHNSWVKGVRVVNCPAPRACVVLYQADHVTVRDSYFYGSVSFAGGSTTYGIETMGVCDALVENNIVHHRTSPFVSDGDCGSVFGYNYVLDDYYPISPPWMQASQYSHEGGNSMILHEGNEGVGIKGDIIHGTSNLFTFVRNYMHGWEPGKTAETNPVNLYAYNRYYHFVGNVFGESSYHSTYQADSETAIWNFGRDYAGVPADPLAAPTMLRWGNWDTVTSTNDNGANDLTGIRFVSSEVPSGLANYPNPVPSTQTLPASFYRSAKPTWFGSIAWPPIGPDVSGGSISNTGGHAHKIPARVCFETSTNDPAYPSSNPRIKTFSASSCYPSGGDPVPAPEAPTNLRIVP